jgi:NAD(P)-dependent dehydrogenase (short-subunit alcohol dehydrogenase family)
MQVTGKVWVVTGGGGGMGRELVLEMLRRGARVAAVDVREDALRETAGLAGAAAADGLSLHVLDITDAAATRALLPAVLDAHGAVDGLVNNAGIIQPFQPVADLDDAAIQRVLGVNLFGTINMVRAFLPHLLARPEAHLANVSSMGGFFPFPGQTMYGASKAAVKLLTEGLYAELVDTNVAVSVIMPGAVATDITANSGVAAPGGASADTSAARTTPADVAARIIIDGMEKNRLHIYVGRDAQLLSLAIRVAPRRAILLVQKQMKKMLEPAASRAPQQPVATR